MNVSAIGAHHDAEIGCGGALALHADAGDRVTIACMTDGEAGGIGVPPVKLARIRFHASQGGTVAFDEVALALNRYRSILLRTATHVEVFGTARTTW